MRKRLLWLGGLYGILWRVVPFSPKLCPSLGFNSLHLQEFPDLELTMKKKKKQEGEKKLLELASESNWWIRSPLLSSIKCVLLRAGNDSPLYLGRAMMVLPRAATHPAELKHLLSLSLSLWPCFLPTISTVVRVSLNKRLPFSPWHLVRMWIQHLLICISYKQKQKKKCI